MGCVHGTPARYPSATNSPQTITVAAYGGSARTSRTKGYQSMAPDPDLGWRHVSNALSVPGAGASGAGMVWNDPSEWSNTSPPTAPGRWTSCAAGSSRHGTPSPSYPSPHVWDVHFINDRSGYFCNVPLVTLAINMAIRAERLAKGFGIVGSESAAATTTAPNAGPSPIESQSPTAADVDSCKKIYAALRVPDYDWRLLRRHANRVDGSERSEKRGLSPRIRTPPEMDGSGNKAPPQLVQRGPNGEPVWADIPEIGMNIAEQLYRLERKKDNKNLLPTNSFGWKFNGLEMDPFRVAVSSPDNEGFWIVPEELIMNVTQWVQQTYLTSTAF